ncbi:alpha-galactosidase [Pedobacter deserti]|uniref:alpha-galactosidase n=1 Tax=Pedobacter deserti TaxID=2817382 RepID=UPI00210B4BF5|nr:alpha-galactosidase [Pedobacter sp. SYSU D00382]
MNGFSRLICFLFALLQVAVCSGKQIIIPFGSEGKIVYHSESGLYDVMAGDNKVISSARGAAKNGGLLLNSTDYMYAGHRLTNITDGFGRGLKYVFNLRRDGQPDMEQVFYVYPGHDYFFTELAIRGKRLVSNYLSPIQAGTVQVSASAGNKVLFVPFDNDAFVRYHTEALRRGLTKMSSEVGVIFDDRSRAGLVAGSVAHTEWKTGVKTAGLNDKQAQFEVTAGYTNPQVTRDQLEHGSLTGSVIRSPRIFVGYFDDWRVGMEAYGKANRIHEKPFVFNWDKPVPFGWNSWGVIQTKLSYENATGVADYFAEELPGFRNDHTAYIDLDSFWDNMTGGMRGDYTKLKAFADHCKRKGLQPGVYWAPFTDWGFASGGNRTAEGSKYRFADMWTKVKQGYHDFDGARALDPTHPGTQRRIDFIVDKLKGCGFTMIKIDFLGHAAAESDAFHDKSVTTGMQAYRIGMEYLVKRLDGQMLIYAAISPSMATGRYAHIRRIACDAWKSMKDTEYTLNSVTYGWWQTYVYNFIDADHVVFGDEAEGVNRARLASALVTGTLITGDDFASPGKWDLTAKKLLQNSELLDIARHGVAFRPEPAGSADGAAEVFTSKRNGYMYVAVFNYTGKVKRVVIPLGDIGLKRDRYEAEPLFGVVASPLKASGRLEFALAASDAEIFKIKL